MDKYDFRKIDKEIEQRLFTDKSPPQFELIPIGIYNGIDLPDTYIDENYVVRLEIECPDYGMAAMIM